MLISLQLGLFTRGRLLTPMMPIPGRELRALRFRYRYQKVPPNMLVWQYVLQVDG
jgi:hypothetical protein